MGTTIKKNNLTRVATLLFFTVLIAITARAESNEWLGGYSFIVETDDEGSYYKVDNEEVLYGLAQYVNNGGSTTGKRFKQTADITMSGSTFTPIGNPNDWNYTASFNGTYDGNGKAIIGIRVSTSSTYAGLFGVVYQGTVKNVTMVNPDITSTSSLQYRYAGGVVGNIQPGKIINCNVINPTLSAAYTGAICGRIGIYSDTYIKDCYYYASNNMKAVGYNVVEGPVTADRAYTMTLDDGITTSATPAFSYNGVNYYAGAINLDTPPVGIVYVYRVNGSAIDGNTFTIAADATISRTFHVSPLLGWTDSYSPDGSADYPYVISSEDGWNLFCDCLNDKDTWNRFSGKTVKLGADIDISRMAGGEQRDFCGTFDGDGHELSFDYGTSNMYSSIQYVAPFRYVSSDTSEDGTEIPTTIKHLYVRGNIYTTAKFAAGIVAQHWGTLNIVDCHSYMFIHSRLSGDGSHGGLVGHTHQNATLNIEGCAVDGKMLYTSTKATTNCGGFVGWSDGTVTISNSLYDPAEISTVQNEKEVEAGTDDHPSCTFGRNVPDANITNCYYTRLLGNAQGKAKLNVTAGDDVTVEAVAPVGNATATYSTNGITAYGNGLERGDTFYYGCGDEVSLTLSNTPPTGYGFISYTANNGGTITGSENPYTLTMSDADVTVGATFGSLANVTFAPAGFCTYYNGTSDVILPTGVKAHIVTAKGDSNGTLTYETIANGDTKGNIVPAGTAVILQTDKSTEEQQKALTQASHGGALPEAPADNLLHGSDDEGMTTGNGKHYKLTYSNNNDNFGWYWGATNGAAFTLAGHKAWLVLPNDLAGACSFFALPVEHTTSMPNAEDFMLHETGAWYTLDGRKVMNDNDNSKLKVQRLPKGVYIHGGHQVIVK